VLSSFPLWFLLIFWVKLLTQLTTLLTDCLHISLLIAPPNERLFVSFHIYHNLHVFRSDCFVLLQPHERTKLEPRSRLCCFFGYRVEQKGYRCYDCIPPLFSNLDFLKTYFQTFHFLQLCLNTCFCPK